MDLHSLIWAFVDNLCHKGFFLVFDPVIVFESEWMKVEINM